MSSVWCLQVCGTWCHCSPTFASLSWCPLPISSWSLRGLRDRKRYIALNVCFRIYMPHFRLFSLCVTQGGQLSSRKHWKWKMSFTLHLAFKVWNVHPVFVILTLKWFINCESKVKKSAMFKNNGLKMWKLFLCLSMSTLCYQCKGFLLNSQSSSSSSSRCLVLALSLTHATDCNCHRRKLINHESLNLDFAQRHILTNPSNKAMGCKRFNTAASAPLI